ncbi:hypothetical protein BDM02DRAFT_875468 [Thelephora ganbajun]|uniref:Uncharacterized protein n=1 Tax=Thelephora ganbajun TaxID=370292 RepID=A0ACB6Z559_THEGA|nr:hypothetical protein BDM02DRAFT_875468 [Thelephora ganbajun]
MSVSFQAKVQYHQRGPICERESNHPEYARRSSREGGGAKTWLHFLHVRISQVKRLTSWIKYLSGFHAQWDRSRRKSIAGGIFGSGTDELALEDSLNQGDRFAWSLRDHLLPRKHPRVVIDQGWTMRMGAQLLLVVLDRFGLTMTLATARIFRHIRSVKVHTAFVSNNIFIVDRVRLPIRIYLAPR